MRQTVRTLATVSFVMMVTGVTLRLHLAHFKNPGRHHSEHCPVCQLLLTVPKKVALEPDPPVLDDCLLAFFADTCPVGYVQTYYPHQTWPRGPPSVC
jgi:hypothetical protein